MNVKGSGVPTGKPPRLTPGAGVGDLRLAPAGYDIELDARGVIQHREVDPSAQHHRGDGMTGLMECRGDTLPVGLEE